MLFPTAEYGLFFLFVFMAAWGLQRSLRAHHGFLLAASYAFYAFGDWRSLSLLICISVFAGVVAQRLQAEARPAVRKTLITIGVALALSTLCLFKYVGFLAALAVSALELIGLRPPPVRLPEVGLPVGISFFVFHAISLMVDAYRRRIPVQVRMLDALLYVAFFPQLVAGPILRASTFLPQLSQAPDPGAIEASRAIGLIVLGLVKKVLIASFLATHLVDPVFESPYLHTGFEAVLAMYGYAGQIFCDFSGYTDLAMGSALLLGYRFPANFRAPGLADSLQDFWRRWHISLSTWLRDYLFIPLGGSRRGTARTLLNLALTMVLGGLWHGAAWTFVLWGALHGVGLIAHRLWAASTFGPIARLRAWRPWRVMAIIATFHFVSLGWVFFRSSSVAAAFELFSAMAGPWSVGPWLSPALIGALVAGVVSQLVPPRSLERLRGYFERLPLPAQGVAFGLAILGVEALAPQGIAPFIYFRF